MKNLRLLIVDDVEDNRLVLHAICRKMQGFEIKEAVDGIDAIAVCEEWHPHIILMDVMMPNLDGFEASKVIKSRFPETVIIILTAVIDPKMEANMSSIGVAAYLHKPIDKELVRFKIQNFGSVLRLKEGDHAKLSTKETLNPFCSDLRHYKTIFDINDAEGMMDFGVWILSRCTEQMPLAYSKVDPMIELFYELMRQRIRDKEVVSIICEESFEEIFVTMKFDKPIVLKPKTEELVNDLQSHCIIRDNIACVRLNISGESIPGQSSFVTTIKKIPVEEKVQSEGVTQKEVEREEIQSNKEVRTIDAKEQGFLRQSFVHKTTAIDYVTEIGGGIIDEIHELESLDEEWRERLHVLERDPSIENIRQFVDGVLGIYVRTINNLFEFTALAYALSSLGIFMKEHADTIIADSSKLKMLVMLTEYLGSDLTSWREHIFSLQDAGDIHYLDSSFFSSCMQIEGIIGNKQLDVDDDNDMEFF
ncbi:MAG: response regulator [Campylobacterales bacterium]|nr:response regulator [Campylobacterales bacterium]